MKDRLHLKSIFLKSTLVLMSGTVLSQVLSLAFAPIITRLYTPDEAAPLGLFIRLISIGAAIASARFELALPIIKNNAHSFRLYHVALRTAIIVSVLSLVIVLYPLFVKKDNQDFVFYLLIPFSIFLLAYFNIGTNWAIRMKYFRTISLAKITNSAFSNFLKISFGLLNFGYIGLVFGAFGGYLLANIWFLRDYFSAQKKYKIKSNSVRNYVLAKQYLDFPKINLPHVLMDLSKDLLVAILLLEFFGKNEFGLYDHSYRMLRIPLIFVGAAIGQVFFQRCSEMINNNENIMPLVSKSIKTLALLSIIPFCVIFIYGYEIFGFVFGENWAESGHYSQIMAPWFMMNFICSSISSLPIVLRKQKLFFNFAIVGTITMLLCTFIPPFIFEAGIKNTLWIISLGQTCYFVFFIFILTDKIKKSNV